jgi:Mn-dependent DtxR family transcriptional regulator
MKPNVIVENKLNIQQKSAFNTLKTLSKYDLREIKPYNSTHAYQQQFRT